MRRFAPTYTFSCCFHRACCWRWRSCTSKLNDSCDPSVIPWLRERDVAVIGFEVPGYRPQPPGDVPGFHVHNFALAMLGMQVLDRADFDAVAEAAAARNRWEFMLVISPLRIRNGTGSMVNPLAIF